MNTVERIIHGIVRNHPGIRKNIVVAYQRAFSLFPAKPYECSHALIHHPGSFYGFHDKCPWSADGSKLLAHRFDISKSIDDLERNPVEVGFYEGENYEIYRPIESTLAWNWQQGSSLQWVGESNRVVFNGDFDGTSTATLVDLDTGNRRRLHGQVMSVSNDGKWAASCSFDRLGHGMPGYGYALTDDNVLTKELCPEQEAIAILDLENDKVMSVVALEHVLDFRNGHVEGGLYHYFSHCLFSPDSKRMVFYHRCLYKTGILLREYIR